MAEPYFQFKKFRVYHSAGGFKVGTDGVLLGAWAPAKDGDSVLDIGTGTGIISLMIAQRAKVSVDLIEINPIAAGQAKRNVMCSPFSNMTVYNEAIADFTNRGKQYDFIVCNPPFYSHSQPSKDVSIRLAKHTVTLKPADLFKYASQLLKPDGRFAVIFPQTEYDVFFNSAKAEGFFAREIVNVFPQPDYPLIRLMVCFTKENNGESNMTDFLIEKSAKRHDYSEEYKEWTKDYFLRF
ncbi:MAG: methyltransferase [Flavobacteriales bacterium]|jgi:tRNA1Val (adenine37-N6)-methyltransferase|nr:methyltransferase [Flavobacteriales bacterium]